MKVAELKAILSKYPDDKQVMFTLAGAEHTFWADVVTTDIGGSPVIESIDAVEFGDVVGMAEQCYDVNGSGMAYAQLEALRDFILTAKESENES